jgi:dihydroxy-acid dehydratase
MTMGTASTMAATVEALGLTLPVPVHPRLPVASAYGFRRRRRIVEMVWEDLKPRDIMTTEAFENAVTAAMALGGSTKRHHPPVRWRPRRRRAGPRSLRHCRAGPLPREHPAVGQVPDGGRYTQAAAGVLDRFAATGCLSRQGGRSGKSSKARWCNDEVIARRSARSGRKGWVVLRESAPDGRSSKSHRRGA